MDDTNITIVYSGSKWSRIVPTIAPWVNNSAIYLSGLTHSVCTTTDGCSVFIPFTGSGVTVYNVIRSSITVGITIEGRSSTYSFADDNSCLNNTNSGCFNTSIYDAQSLPYGDHNLSISMFSVPPSVRSFNYSDFYLDYVSVNETPTDTIVPSPIISPAPTILPTPPSSSSTTSDTSPTTTSNPSPSRPLSGGGVAGIVVGVLLVCALVMGALHLFTEMFSIISGMASRIPGKWRMWTWHRNPTPSAGTGTQPSINPECLNDSYTMVPKSSNSQELGSNEDRHSMDPSLLET